MTKKIAIIDYGAGNLMSVLNAIEFVGGNGKITSNPKDLLSFSHAILPGVGAFAEGMKNLRTEGWLDLIYDFANIQKKPFLGICLGMQLLADSSTEHGLHEGLGLIPGSVKRFDSDKGLRIPHVGWNTVYFSEPSKTYAGLEEKEDYYFVNSYKFHPENPEHISGTSDYGVKFCASVEKDNVWGTQFHPEKSQKAGLKIIENFLEFEIC